MKITASIDLILLNGSGFTSRSSIDQRPSFLSFLSCPLNAGESDFLEYSCVTFRADEMELEEGGGLQLKSDGSWRLDPDEATVDSNGIITIPGVLCLELQEPFPENKPSPHWTEELKELSAEGRAMVMKGDLSARHILYLVSRGQVEAWGLDEKLVAEVVSAMKERGPKYPPSWEIKEEDFEPVKAKALPTATSKVEVFRVKDSEDPDSL